MFPVAGGGETIDGDASAAQELDDREGSGDREFPVRGEEGGADGAFIGVTNNCKYPVHIGGNGRGELLDGLCNRGELFFPGLLQIGRA